MILLKKIDYFLDRITMYRLVLYILIAILCIATFLASLQLIPYSPFSISGTALFFVAICWAANYIFATFFDAPTNVESFFITALILALIITPISTAQQLIFAGYIGIFAMASKFIFTLRKKHLFNPAAIAPALAGLIGFGSASWWVGTAFLAPFVAFAAFLIARKLRFEKMVVVFMFTAFVVSIFLAILNGSSIVSTGSRVLLNSHLLFLGGIMLTEPLTLPPTQSLRIIYAVVVGIVSVPQVNIYG